MKRAKTTGQLKAQCSAIMAAAVNGEIDLKRARIAISAAHAIARLHEAEAGFIVSMLRDGRKVQDINEGPLHDGADEAGVTDVPSDAA